MKRNKKQNQNQDASRTFEEEEEERENPCSPEPPHLFYMREGGRGVVTMWLAHFSPPPPYSTFVML